MSDALDFEELAAYIEGRLDEPRRARMAARLARDPEAYELFAASLRAVDEEAAEGGAEVVVHPAAYRRWIVGSLAAAVLLALALIFFLRAPWSSERLIDRFDRDRVATLPERSTERVRWFDSGRVYRGDPVAIEEVRLAARLGIGVVDLAASLAADDGPAREKIIARMAAEAEASQRWGGRKLDLGDGRFGVRFRGSPGSRGGPCQRLPGFGRASTIRAGTMGRNGSTGGTCRGSSDRAVALLVDSAQACARRSRAWRDRGERRHSASCAEGAGWSPFGVRGPRQRFGRWLASDATTPGPRAVRASAGPRVRALGEQPRALFVVPS